MIHTKQGSPPRVEDPFCREIQFCRGSIPFYNLPSPLHWIFWGRPRGVSKISQVASLIKKSSFGEIGKKLSVLGVK
jgi:hypothetical protein